MVNYEQQYQPFTVWVPIVYRIGLLRERTGLGTGFIPLLSDNSEPIKDENQ